MKLYTDHSGKFQMYIPIEWQYKNPILYNSVDGGKPQAFALYDDILGAFQISCKPINDHISNLIKTRREPIQSSNAKKLIFSEVKSVLEKTEIYMFSCAVDDHYLFATYTITDKDEKLNDKYNVELKKVREALASIKFIKPEFRQKVIALRRFDLFMASIATTIDLKNRAMRNNSFIEYVVLSANHIDALLRLSIILKYQIESKNDGIDTSFLFQSESDKPIIEREVYKLTLDKGIISQQIYDDLEELYKQRNKVVHRYIITDIRTDEILKIASDYGMLGEKVGDIVNNLESDQVKQKVGIHKDNSKLGKKPDGFELEKLISSIKDKHGKIKFEDILNQKE
jgi:uncharacterized protein YutE (UPF0331/DUF86 family)